MKGTVVLFCIAVLFIIFWQDIKQRAVSAYLFALLATALIIWRLMHVSFSTILMHSLVNLLFIFFQVLLLAIYFSFKEKKWINIADRYIGWGDLIFFLCLAIVLSPGNFILFHLLSLMLTIMVVITSAFFSKKTLKAIPLAGIQAFLLAVLFIISILRPSPFSIENDEWWSLLLNPWSIQ